MLSPDRSPLHRLVLRYRSSDPSDMMVRRTRHHSFCRAEIWTAAAVEHEELDAANVAYSPSDDFRVKWLLSWCDVLEGAQRRIDPRLTASMEFLCGFDRPTLSGKDRAAGEHLTLAQGS